MPKVRHERLDARIRLQERFRLILQLRKESIRQLEALVTSFRCIKFGIRIHRKHRRFQVRKRRRHRLQCINDLCTRSNRFTRRTPLHIERVRSRSHLLLAHNRSVNHILENVKRLKALFATQVGNRLHTKREQQQNRKNNNGDDILFIHGR